MAGPRGLRGIPLKRIGTLFPPQTRCEGFPKSGTSPFSSFSHFLLYFPCRTYRLVTPPPPWFSGDARWMRGFFVEGAHYPFLFFPLGSSGASLHLPVTKIFPFLFPSRKGELFLGRRNFLSALKDPFQITGPVFFFQQVALKVRAVPNKASLQSPFFPPPPFFFGDSGSKGPVSLLALQDDEAPFPKSDFPPPTIPANSLPFVGKKWRRSFPSCNGQGFPLGVHVFFVPPAPVRCKVPLHSLVPVERAPRCSTVVSPFGSTPTSLGNEFLFFFFPCKTRRNN